MRRVRRCSPRATRNTGLHWLAHCTAAGLFAPVQIALVQTIYARHALRWRDNSIFLTSHARLAKVRTIKSTLTLDDGATLDFKTIGDPANRPIVLLGPGNAPPDLLHSLAERLSSDFLVELVPLPGDGRGGDWTSAALDAVGAPALVVGYGQSCRAAFVSTRLREVKALMVVDASLPHPDTDDPGVSTLILRGRQAERLTHADAVALMNRLPGSRLYELEDCADDPAVEAPDALETAIRWFIDHLPEDGPAEYSGENSGQSGA